MNIINEVIPLVCTNCGGNFNRHSRYIKVSDHVFCSRICRLAFLRQNKPEKVMITCCRCGKKVFRFKNHILDINHAYCSSVCRRLAQYTVSKQCTYCNKQFWVLPSQQTRKFCSNSCYGKSLQQRITVVCKGCGELFTKSPASVQRYCSVKCKKQARNKTEHRKCFNCDKEFITLICSPKYYCSTICRIQKVGNPSQIGICKRCNKKFIIRKRYLSLGKISYCSKECLISDNYGMA